MCFVKSGTGARISQYMCKYISAAGHYATAKIGEHKYDHWLDKGHAFVRAVLNYDLEWRGHATLVWRSGYDGCMTLCRVKGLACG